MLIPLLAALSMAFASPSSDTPAAGCEATFVDPYYRQGLIRRLIYDHILSVDDREKALIRAVTVRLRRPARSWSLSRNDAVREDTNPSLPAVLIHKASEDVVILLRPDGDARELLMLPDLSCDVVQGDVLIGAKRKHAPWRCYVPARALPTSESALGRPTFASMRGRPVIAWLSEDALGRDRVVITTPGGEKLRPIDVLELENGARVQVMDDVITKLLPHASFLRESVAEMRRSAVREFIREFWPLLGREIERHELVEMKKAEIMDATINGRNDFRAMVGPPRAGRSWVIVINPRTRQRVIPENETMISSGAGGLMTPLRRAFLEDGRALKADWLTWWTQAGGGGDLSPATVDDPRGGPTSAARRTRALESAE